MGLNQIWSDGQLGSTYPYNLGKLSHGTTFLKEDIFLEPFVIDTFWSFEMIGIFSLG